MKTFFVLTLLLFAFGAKAVRAQSLAYKLSVQNVKIDMNVMSFDVNLTCTQGTGFEFAQLQPVFNLNPEFFNGGELSVRVTNSIGISSNPLLTGEVLYFFIRKWDNPHVTISNGETKTILTAEITTTAESFGQMKWTWRNEGNPFTKLHRYNGIEIIDFPTSAMSHEPINTVTAINEPVEVVKDFQLEQNYPNPFNPTTTIKFSLREKGFARLKIWDVTGKNVLTAVDNALEPGNYETTFDGSNFPSGHYFYNLIVNGEVSETKKLTLIK